MTTYPKIDSVYARDDKGRFIIGQYAREEFEYLSSLPWAWTEKVDGTNIRIEHVVGEHTIRTAPHACIKGRTDNAQLPPKLLSALIELVQATEFEAWAARLDLGTKVVFYGEGYGAGIQGAGKTYRSDPGFVLFDVKVGDWWLQFPNVIDVALVLGWDVVPIVAPWSLEEAVAMMRAMAAGTVEKFASQWPGAVPEGIVGQPIVPLWNRKGERIITKLKFRDFRP